jgi:hypothetical protein
MARKFKNTEQMQLAAGVLEFMDWQMERSEQQKLIDEQLAALDQRMGRQRGPKIIYTVEVMKLRGFAMETLKNQIIAHTSGICDGSVKMSFKRLHEQRDYGHHYQH